LTLRFLKALLLLAAPLSAFGFESVDTLTPATSGRYPAYPTEGFIPRIWAQAGAMYDSNVLRRPTGNNEDYITRVGVGAADDLHVYSRQIVHLEGRVDGYHYDHFSGIDNVGYAALGEWRWATVGDLAGAVGASQRRYQADIAQTQAAVADPITERHAYVNAGWLVGPTVRVRGALDGLKYERPHSRDAELNTYTATVGADYVTSLTNTVGVEYVQGRGDAPLGVVVDPINVHVSNDFTQREVAVVGGWQAGAFLRFAARLGHLKREYTQVPERNFDGATWRVAADWNPTYKTALSFEAYSTPTVVVDIAASHILVHSVAFGPGWAPTTKLNFTMRFLRQHMVFAGDPTAALIGTPVTEDTVRGVRFGAFWEYTRHFTFQGAIDHGTRDSNTLGRGYTYSAIVLNAKYLF